MQIGWKYNLLVWEFEYAYYKVEGKKSSNSKTWQIKVSDKFAICLFFTCKIIKLRISKTQE